MFYMGLRDVTLDERIRGSIYGFMIGDAMGATNEFKHRVDIRGHEVNDIVGGGWLNLQPGQTTDDTAMMFCVADAGMKYQRGSKSYFLDRCCKNFAEWAATNPPDIGKQCRYMINYCSGYPYYYWQKVAKNEDAMGNGALMRAIGTVLAFPKYENMTVEQGMLTHNAETQRTVLKAYHNVLVSLLLGKSYALRTKEIGVGKALMEPTGHVINTFNNALYFLNDSRYFSYGMLRAVNDGGDADTIAAITGSMLGAKFGFSNIPRRWVDQLNKADRIHAEIIIVKSYEIFKSAYLQKHDYVL